MGQYISNTLRPGESVVYQAHLSIWTLCSNMAIGAVFFLLSVIAMTFRSSMQGEGTMVILGGSIILFLVGLYTISQSLAGYYTTELAVTNKRVISKRGWVSRTTTELLLGKVESVQVSQGSIQRMLGYGDIVISAAGEENAMITGISDPTVFSDQFYKTEEKSRVGDKA